MNRNWMFSLLWLLSATPVLASLPPLPENEAFKPVFLEGQDLPMALALPLEELSLAAMVDGEMEPIPFQIDQYNQGGAPYFANWEVPLAGFPQILNPTDKLLFVLKDAGIRYDPVAPPDGSILAEIRLQDSAGQFRFVYLMRNARLRSDEQYVRYSPELGLVETDFYALQYRNANHLEWQDLQVKGYVGERPLDSIKLSVTGGVVAPQLQIELTGSNMIAKPAGALIGPIRTVTQADFRVYWMGVNFMRLSLQIHHYPKSIIYDVRGVMPAFLRQFANNPKVTMIVDANDMLGAEIRSATGPAEPAMVDGEMGAIEKQMMQAGLTREQNWVAIRSKRNLDMISFLDYVGNFDEPLSLLLDDDRTRQDADELFPGHLPSIGYRIEHLPEDGPIGVVASVYFSERFEGDLATTARQIRHQPDIQIFPYTQSANYSLGLNGSR